MLPVLWWWWERSYVYTTTAFFLGERKLGTSMPVGDTLKTWSRCTWNSVNRGRESASAYHMAGFTQMFSGSLRKTFCKKCNHDKFFRGFNISGDFINLLLCFYSSGGCILARMLIVVSLISQRKKKSCLLQFRLRLGVLCCVAIISGLVQHLPCWWVWMTF